MFRSFITIRRSRRPTHLSLYSQEDLSTALGGNDAGMATILGRYVNRLAAIPALAKFCGEAEKLVSADDPESFWRVEPAFRDLLSSDFVEAFLTHELNLVAKDQLYFM